MPRWKRTFAAVWAANLVTAIGMQAFLPFFASHLEALGMRERDEVAMWAGLLFGACCVTVFINDNSRSTNG